LTGSASGLASQVSESSRRFTGEKEDFHETDSCSLGAFCFLVAGALIAAATALGVVPVSDTPPATTQTTINNGAGNQTDPHLSGDLATYTSDVVGTTLAQIRYYSFATGTDAGIANGGNADVLSDVSGSRIVFTRISSGNQSIWLFNAATGGSPVELDPSATSQRRGAAIGGNTVAWIDVTASTRGEVVVHDLATSTSQQLTTNTLIDRRLAVSPDGNVVVWEQCTTTSSCDIAQAVRSDGVWTIGAASATADNETLPDTNGSIVVYGVARATSLGGPDIYWKSVAGGTEQELSLDGTQQNPNVSGSLISFGSIAPSSTNAELFVYDVSANTLYQVTNTAALSEALNDVSVIGNTVRIVWAVVEGSDNVYGLTFQLPSSVVTTDAAFDPGTLNLKSKGAYLTAYLEFPAGRSPADIDVSSITLQAIAPVTSAKTPLASGAPTAVGDADGDGVADLMVKFDRGAVQSWFSSDADPATLRTEGRFSDGTPFRGDASIRVMNAGVAHTDEANPASVKY
jgi:Tol biopolymer transport system component